MNKKVVLLSLFFIVGFFEMAFSSASFALESILPAFDYVLLDTVPLIEDRYGDFINDPNNNSFDLSDPEIIETTIEYDPVTDQYIIYERIGEEYFRPPTYLTFDEYLDWRAGRQQEEYFRFLGGISSGDKSNADQVDPITRIDLTENQDPRVKKLLNASTGRLDPIAKLDLENKLLDRLFGGTEVEIKPQGNIDLTFGYDYQETNNFNIPERARRTGGPDFDMNIQMNVVGNIGDKLKLNTNYNTLATFDFENIMKLDYNSSNFSEDDIIKSIEAGNVSLPLRGTLIQGAQSLFGIKTEVQFGYLRLTGVASQQKSKREEIQLQGGSQLQQFEVTADRYDENRHFFLSHYNRNTFEGALTNLPQINSLFHVENIQVWVTNEKRETQNTRQIVALTDLGEYERMTNPNIDKSPFPLHPDITGQKELPNNYSNGLYQSLLDNPQTRFDDKVVSILQAPAYGLQQGQDFEVISARLLSPTEYTYHPELGYVSLNISLRPDQVVGVAYEYTYNGLNSAADGTVLKVGEIQNDADRDSLKVLFVKLLKAKTIRIDLPFWDLMMKNVYNIGAYQVSREDFRLDVFYEDPGGGSKRFLPEEGLSQTPLLRFFNLDNLNTQNDPQPDGQFDFVEGFTINSRTGRIMFPVLEPFGSSLATKIGDPIKASRYIYPMLYDSTIYRAQEYQEFNRFTIKGSFKSSVSNEISLGSFNLPRGSVRVTAGGQLLVEGQDYEVDYNIGKVKILNDSYLNSGLPIKVSFEDNTLFGFNTRSLIGLRADYEIKKNFNIGATYLHLFERPYTQKVNIGDDPINNRIYGFDVNFSKEVPWLTKAIDKLPLIQTKQPSNINFTAETAILKPGHSNAINQGAKKDRQGTVYLDDFEGSISPIDLRLNLFNWQISSVPQNDNANNNPLFPESGLVNDRDAGVNRAKLLWYNIESLGLNQADLDDPYTKPVQETEIFPNRQLPPFQQLSIFRTFDLTYFPSERGPYNFDVPGGTDYSPGIGFDGKLLNPEDRWAGVMRGLTTTDFEAANVEFLEFWMLDPTMNDTDRDNNGTLYINLGNISEDILRDGRDFYENSIAPNEQQQRDIRETAWGRIPLFKPPINAFDNTSPAARDLQDVGLDGLNDGEEVSYFSDYLASVNGNVAADVQAGINADPANDNFVSFRSDSFPDTDRVFDRYFRFNNPERNSPINTSTFQAGKNLPDTEDINNDNTFDQTEQYYQYEIPLNPDPTRDRGLALNSFITDTIFSANTGTWYRFKVPIDQFQKKVGGIQDFRSIRFIRMYMKGFTKPVTLRFASLDLVRNQWRRYKRSLEDRGAVIVGDEDNTIFDVNAVNIEENSGKLPFGYTLPNGIEREPSLNSSFPSILQNEQSMLLNICGLQPNDARGIYKLLGLDLRLYKRLKMFVHAESPERFENGKTSIFLRIGSDFENNYYEYEVPLSLSDPAALGPNPNPNDTMYINLVWKSENEFDFPFSVLQDIKKERNLTNSPLNQIYTIQDPEKPLNTVKVKGNPNLGIAKGVLIGIRNNDDISHCVEVWVNELRVSGLEERGGAAALARLDVQMADLGQVTLSGNFSSIGFGALDQRLLERSIEEVVQYDVATNIELGKLLPEKSGIKIPFYAQVSEQFRSPRFDPYDLDIELKDKLSDITDQVTRDSVREAAQTYQAIKGYNFTNVRKERTGDSKPFPWDISNFSLTYARNQTTRTDPIIELNQEEQTKGGLDYNYSPNPRPIQPFKSLKADKYLKFIKELNFNPVPNSVAFNTNLDRRFNTTKYRFAGDDPQFNTYFNKRFTWDRTYDLQWDLTKMLKLNFSALSNNIIDEPEEFRPDGGLITNQERWDSIWTNIKTLGRPKNYTHNINVSYTLPFKTLPYLDWITVKAQAGATYGWSAASLAADSLGNVIQNTQNRQLNGDLNFEGLYNSFKYLKKINTPKKGKGGKGGGSDSPKGSDDKAPPAGDKGDKGTAGAKATRGNPKETDSKTDAVDNKEPLDSKTKGDVPAVAGKEEKGKTGAPEDKNAAKTATGKPGATGTAEKKEEKKKEVEPSDLERAIIRPLMALRKGRFTYSEQLGSVIPGFTPRSEFLGMRDFEAPGWDYITGFTPDDAWLDQSAANGWFTKSIYMNQQVQKRYTQQFNANVTLEPFADFRIELDATRNYTRDHTEFFKYRTEIDGFRHDTPRDLGSFTVSYGALNTLFIDKTTDLNQLFKDFESNRAIISGRIAPGAPPSPLDSIYRDGYGKAQQEVLIPAFIATYTNQDPNAVSLDIFKTLPKVNWKFTYNGLSKLPMFKNVFQSVNISHGYKSTLTVNSYSSDLDYIANPGGRNPNNQNYYARFEIPNIVITEQFSPLLGIDMRFKNDMSIRCDFKKSRTLNMGFADFQLNEIKSTEYVVGFGFKLKDFHIGFLDKLQKSIGLPEDDKKKPADKSSTPSGGRGGATANVNDLNVKFDFSLRDDVTFIHRLDEATDEATRGATDVRISPSIDYQMNKRINLRLFVNYQHNLPKTSAAFETTNIEGGLTVRFTLN